jgi:trans-aconitate methyltransferase
MSTVQHAMEAFSMVSHLLPDSISTVHDYGCRDGQGTLWLSSQFSTVVGYDTDTDRWRDAKAQGIDLRSGDVRDPQEDADLIYVGHVLEGSKWRSDFTDRHAIVERLRERCRYLLLQVHRMKHEVYDWQNGYAPDALVHSCYTCIQGRPDSVTLLRGYL